MSRADVAQGKARIVDIICAEAESTTCRVKGRQNMPPTSCWCRSVLCVRVRCKGTRGFVYKTAGWVDVGTEGYLYRTAGCVRYNWSDQKRP